MPPQPQSYANKQALVIEDQQFIRQVVVRILRQLNFAAVMEAEDGSSGLAIAAWFALAGGEPVAVTDDNSQAPQVTVVTPGTTMVAGETVIALIGQDAPARAASQTKLA